MIKSIVCFLSISYCGLTAGAVSNQAAPLFDYQIILDAQKKCDDSEIKKLAYPESRKDVFTLAKKSRVVVSGLSLKEVHRSTTPVIGETRDYEINFSLFAQLACGKDEFLIENGKGEKTTELPVVRRAWKQPSFVDIVGDEKGDDVFKPGLSVAFTANDLPPEPGVNGLACIVEKDIFLKANPKEFALNLCGKDASSEALKRTIDAVVRTQKAVGKTAKNQK